MFDKIRYIVNENFKKGLIDELTYLKANIQLSNIMENEIIKGGGEGSRGGKVIGHTKSGKPIYEKFHGYSKYSPEDHKDAAEHHEKHGNKEISGKHHEKHKNKSSKEFFGHMDKRHGMGKHGGPGGR